MNSPNRASRVNSDTLNERGEALCYICKRKKSLPELYNCDYCGKWVCKVHIKKGPLGGKICERCAK